MSTETPAVEPQGAPATPTPATVAPAAPAQETDWKAEARKWETRAKENTAAATRLAELEEASKSDAQKQAERTAAVEAENAALKSEKQVNQWRAEVARETGVPVDALRGSTLEDLQAHAQTIKSLIGQTPPGAVGPYVPNEGNTPSSQSTAQLTERDLESMKPEQIQKARLEGRLNKLLGIT